MADEEDTMAIIASCVAATIGQEVEKGTILAVLDAQASLVETALSHKEQGTAMTNKINELIEGKNTAVIQICLGLGIMQTMVGLSKQEKICIFLALVREMFRYEDSRKEKESVNNGKVH